MSQGRAWPTFTFLTMLRYLEDAVEFCKSNYVDICFMDINMPIMNGIDATSKISAELNNQGNEK